MQMLWKEIRLKLSFHHDYVRRYPMNTPKNLIPLILVIIFIAYFPTAAHSSATILSFNPTETQLSSLQQFAVNITVSSVTDLSAWQLKISYNPTIVQCINVSIPENNIFAGHSTTGLSFKIDNQIGTITAFNGLWETTGVSGSGVICQITFNAINPGISSLTFKDVMNLSGTYLIDSKDDLIPIETYDGIVTIAPTDFGIYKFNVQNHNVTVLTNSSLTNFNFNSTLKFLEFSLNGTIGTVGSCSVSIPKELLNGTFAVLINNKATIYSSSEDKFNNHICFTYNQGQLYIKIITTLREDLNGDRKVDAKDIAIVGKAFGSYPGNPRWNPIADLDRDLKVDAKDVATVCKAFGKFYAIT